MRSLHRGRGVLLMVGAALGALVVRCGSDGFGHGTDAGPGLDATTTDSSSADGGASDATVFGDSATDAAADVSCTLGSAGSFATQASLDLFGQTVYFADGGSLPPGNYEIAYVDGCMKYSAPQDWTVNAYPEDAGDPRHWYLVTPASDGGLVEILTPPGTSGFDQQGGAYATFADCVTANQKLDQPKDFVFDGGALGLWLDDSPYSDNVAGDNSDNPKWSLTLVGQPCPSPK